MITTVLQCIVYSKQKKQHVQYLSKAGITDKYDNIKSHFITIMYSTALRNFSCGGSGLSIQKSLERNMHKFIIKMNITSCQDDMIIE